MRSIILASASPRRRELLALSGWAFSLCAVDAVEIPTPGELPAAFVQRMSVAKAQLAAAQVDGDALIIGADTVVALDDQILGKPADRRAAVDMLTRLRGRPHDVLTGLTVLDTAHPAMLYTDLACSRVPMRAYRDDEIETYVASGDPLDKAGAYAIQHPEFHPVDETHFADCFANVMGLPLCHLLRRLRSLGLDSPADLPTACQRFIPYRCPVSETILRNPA